MIENTKHMQNTISKKHTRHKIHKSHTTRKIHVRQNFQNKAHLQFSHTKKMQMQDCRLIEDIFALKTPTHSLKIQHKNPNLHRQRERKGGTWGKLRFDCTNFNEHTNFQFRCLFKSSIMMSPLVCFQDFSCIFLSLHYLTNSSLIYNISNNKYQIFQDNTLMQVPKQHTLRKKTHV